MTITSTSLALGSWSVKLRPGTPQDVIDKLAYLGHVAVAVGRPDPRISGDSLLRSARYVGVLRKITYADEGPALSGAGMMYWLGDENKKGAMIKAQLLFTNANFANAFSQCIAQGQSARLGTISPVSGGYTGYHQFVTVREAVTFICSTMTSDTTNPVEFRVNGDGTVDAGTASDLYVHDTPQAAIVRRFGGSADMHVRALAGTASVDEDIEDYANEVILLGQGEGLGIASAEVTLPDAQVPYRDLFGNVVKITRLVSQSSTDAANSLQQAQIALNQYASPRDAVTLSTDEFDIEGLVNVGDSVWVHDPAASLEDTSPSPNEIIFRGERINPVKLRVSELTWPVEQGMSVAYRGPDGAWLDLTDFVVFETGSTSVTVGGYDRSLTNPTGRQEALGSRAAPNTSVPATPVFLPNPVQAVYQSSGTGISKAQIQLRWLRPSNLDGTDIIDGDHYEIRYRTSDGPLSRAPADSGDPEVVYPGSGVYPGSSTYPGSALVGGSAAVIPPGSPTTWAQAAGLAWNQMGTWAQPIAYIAGPWLTAYAAFDTTQLLIQELTPAVPYQFEIRAVDNAVPPNYSDWSAPVEVVMAGDTIPPPTPAPPEVASSLIAVELTHQLGAASGGTFNLPADMHHFEVHGAYEPTFTCSPATLLGKMLANNGMIVSQTPVVATIAVASTAAIYIKVIAVDESGNRSNPSAPVQSTAQLIDDEHISNLTVSKLLAGNITSDWIQTATLSTAPAGGARAGLDALGLFAYNALNQRVWEVQDATGDQVSYRPNGLPSMRVEASTGNVYLYGIDGATPTMQLTASTGQLELHGQFTAGDGVGVGPSLFIDADHGGSPPRPRVRIHHDDGAKHSAFYARPSTDPTDSRFIVANFSDPLTIDGSALIGDPTAVSLSFRSGAIGTGSDEVPRLLIQRTGNVFLDSSATVTVGSTNNNYFIAGTTGAQVVSTGTVKSFVIDHPEDAPDDPRRFLVHACTESPTALVEYTGTAVIEDHLAVVELPSYFEALTEAEGRTVFLQPQLATWESKAMVPSAAPSEITDGRFHIVCPAPDGTRVHWQVKATRRNAAFEVEPQRGDYIEHGDGPYRYLTPRPKDAA